ncbi:helix-turn-helix domain-containing protein [uncultured Sphingomonas sp.]|uniref:MarR family transcriptional regulator n=1 Tax=uncultured Sphingomonas sp. TaxID=158754 RepID=UPI0025F73414|nr:helix-turn-helix domain-containing protein [uncultured Sphingomonas sp.]
MADMEDADITAIRRFNRFYTQTIGALDARFLGTEATLPEARLLFEIATREPVIATVLQDALDMDAGYLSRLVARFATRDWIARVQQDDDARARGGCDLCGDLSRGHAGTTRGAQACA